MCKAWYYLTKSVCKSFPKYWCLCLLQAMNPFPTSIRSRNWVCSLWTFNMASELNCLLFIVAHNHLSGVEGLTSKSLITRMIFGISDCLLFHDSCKHMYISFKQATSFTMTIVCRMFASALNEAIYSVSLLTSLEYSASNKKDSSLEKILKLGGSKRTLIEFIIMSRISKKIL